MADIQNFTNARSLLNALAEAMNLINPEVQDHHQKTAYLAYMTASAAGCDPEELEQIIYASLLHDLGAIVYEVPGKITDIERDAENVSRIGAGMLRGLEEFDAAADIILCCQISYCRLMSQNNCPVSGVSEHYIRLASFVHLADTVSLIVDPGKPVLNQVRNICGIIGSMRGTEFSEEAVDAFMKISENEFIWLDLVNRPTLLAVFTGEIKNISLNETVRLTNLMSRIIDYRSSFTAMHSAGVAASAMKLAELAGMSEDDCMMMRIAGNLHDIGKLMVPRAILEKPGKLTDEEFGIIRERPYFTRLILMNVDGFGKIANWAGFHHEKLNGRGYPFHFGASQLDLGSRIMAVADIFSAITEVRPYRAGMSKEQAMNILNENVKNNAVCGDIVGLLSERYEEVDSIRDSVSREAGKRYFESLERAGANK